MVFLTLVLPLILSFVFVSLLVWGLAAMRHKSLAKLLVGQFLTAFIIFFLIFLGRKAIPGDLQPAHA